MSLMSTLRKIEKANRRMIREAERRQRELQRRQKELAKMAELEQARYEVELYENRIDLIKSVHKECSKQWDWETIKSSSPPFPQDGMGPNEQKARNQLNNYKPGFLDKVFNRSEVKIKELEKEIDKAKQKDIEELKEWQELVDLAKKVLQGDTAVYLQVLQELSPFADIGELGSSLNFKIINLKIMEVELNVHSESVIPQEVKTLTQAGKISVKKMPKGQYFELYQDYVCGCVLRVAREIFAILPLEKVYINAIGETLNTQTGHMDEKPILSVMIPRNTLEKLNFNNIDCSDSMSNFVHNMKFKKTQGFEPVEKLPIS
ncbi:MAG: hypothetical protein ACOY9Y_10710 [Bacillota bacterium]